MSATAYQTLILQEGELPLSPDGHRNRLREHRCTTTLVWPVGVKPTSANSVIVDPCFTPRGWETAVARLATLGSAPADISYYFVTHQHLDHALAVPQGVDRPSWQLWGPGWRAGFPVIAAVACPGHAPDLQALRFPSESGEVWIVGDAILSLEWLLDWRCYWPNGYDVDETVQTWRSVAAILAAARVVIPGHGPAIAVTAALLRDLVEGFAEAPHATSCPDVMTALEVRHTELMTLAK